MLFNASLLLEPLLTKICAEFQAVLRKGTASGILQWNVLILTLQKCFRCFW